MSHNSNPVLHWTDHAGERQAMPVADVKREFEQFLQWRAQQAQPAASGEPAEWQGRVGKHGRWRRIDPPPGETMEQRVAYLRSMPAYEIRALYAAPQPAPARVPLTEAEIASMQREANTTGVQFLQPSTVRWIVRAIEAAHGITAQGEPK